MKISDAFPSKYLRGDDIPVGKEVHVIIESCRLESLNQGEDPKPVLYFVGKQKGLCLNLTNATAIAASYGNETDSWPGRSIIIFGMTVNFQGRAMPGLRVRIPESQPAGVAAQAPATPAAAPATPAAATRAVPPADEYNAADEPEAAAQPGTETPPGDIPF